MDDSTMNNLERKGLDALDQNFELALLHLEVEQHYSCGPISEAFVHHTIWHVFPDLTLWMENKVMVHEDLNDLPRIGISFQLQEGFEEFEWFGNGPHESYCARLAGVRVGRFQRSEEHTSELQSLVNLVCRLLLEKKKNEYTIDTH